MERKCGGGGGARVGFERPSPLFSRPVTCISQLVRASCGTNGSLALESESAMCLSKDVGESEVPRQSRIELFTSSVLHIAAHPRSDRRLNPISFHLQIPLRRSPTFPIPLAYLPHSVPSSSHIALSTATAPPPPPPAPTGTNPISHARPRWTSGSYPVPLAGEVRESSGPERSSIVVA